MVAAGGDEGCVLAVAMLELEAEDAAVEAERAAEVGDLQVNMPDVHARIDRASLHATIVLRGGLAPRRFRDAARGIRLPSP